MSRPKIARKSTAIDMTAMCDVAFLLLSFFILTAKPKESSAVTVATPSSVSSSKAPDKDVIEISINKDGKVFLASGDNADDQQKKQQIIGLINQTESLGLTPTEIATLVKQPVIGVDIRQLKQQASLPSAQVTDASLPGIPVADTTNNQLTKWMRAVNDTYQGGQLHLLLKGDNLVKYPFFKNVLTAFKKNDLLKFQMITNATSVPEGTDLYKTGGSKAEDQQ